MVSEVLLVDDDDSTRFVYHEILHRMNLDVTEAVDGTSALEALYRHAPNLVILDLLLPRVSGREVLDYIYSSPHLDHTRVIIFSAHDAISLKLRQGDVFLLKPLSPQKMREAVQRALTLQSVQH